MHIIQQTMAGPASYSEQKYSLLITGDIDCQAELMAGLENGFSPQLSKPDSRFRGQYERLRLVQVDTENVMLELYKFEERYIDISLDYQYEYCRANGIMILYNVTDEESIDDVFKYSLKNLARFLFPYKETLPPIMLVGSNIEKREEQKVSIERMRMRAEEMGELKLRFAEVSTVTGENVETSLQTITRDMIAHRPTNSEPELLPRTEPQKKQCVIF